MLGFYELTHIFREKHLSAITTGQSTLEYTWVKLPSFGLSDIYGCYRFLQLGKRTCSSHSQSNMCTQSKQCESGMTVLPLGVTTQYHQAGILQLTTHNRAVNPSTRVSWSLTQVSWALSKQELPSWDSTDSVQPKSGFAASNIRFLPRNTRGSSMAQLY